MKGLARAQAPVRPTSFVQRGEDMDAQTQAGMTTVLL